MNVMSASHPKWNVLLSGILIAVIVGSLVVLMRTPGGGGVRNGNSDGGPLSAVIEYPAEWGTTLPDALGRAKFEVPIPDTAEANEANVKEAYLSPSGTTFALVYNNPGEPAGVEAGEEDIEVYAEPFNLSVSPQEAWESDAKLIGDSASIRTVHGVDALVVEPLGESDAERDNPAFVRFVIQGVDISVHGGTDLDLVLRIAESLKLK